MAGDLGKQHRDAPSLGLSPLSRVRLDELLREMLDRVGEVVASRERLRALLDAVVGIVARHAKAHTVRVSVRAADGQLAVVVQDDGTGADAALARGGLINLLDRAADLGGTFEVLSGEGGGTVVDWRVPLTG